MNKHQDPSHLLYDFVHSHPRLMILTGAGISTASGIPDYRDREGRWKGGDPIQGPEFIRSARTRRRYWARSLIGWRHFDGVHPNGAHRALAELERLGRITHLVTQNVDGLHQRAGSVKVTDLHGRLDRVVCLGCRARIARRELQSALERENPDVAQMDAAKGPDGDAQLELRSDCALQLIPCAACGGTLKPDVVFYGENVPTSRVSHTMAVLRASDALLVIGSSLMVYSGFRYCREAKKLGMPLAALNLGRTRADELLDLKIDASCTELLPPLAARFA